MVVLGCVFWISIISITWESVENETYWVLSTESNGPWLGLEVCFVRFNDNVGFNDKV